MKKIALMSLLAVILGVGVFNIVHDQMVVNAYADVPSLAPTRPTAGDQFVYWDNGTTLVGINWSQLSRQMLQDVNWVGLNTTTGAINWNYIGQ